MIIQLKDPNSTTVYGTLDLSPMIKQIVSVAVSATMEEFEKMLDDMAKEIQELKK